MAKRCTRVRGSSRSLSASTKVGYLQKAREHVNTNLNIKHHLLCQLTDYRSSANTVRTCKQVEHEVIEANGVSGQACHLVRMPRTSPRTSGVAARQTAGRAPLTNGLPDKAAMPSPEQQACTGASPLLDQMVNPVGGAPRGQPLCQVPLLASSGLLDLLLVAPLLPAAGQQSSTGMQMRPARSELVKRLPANQPAALP